VDGKIFAYRVKPIMLRQGSPEFIEGLSTNGLTTENSGFGKLFLTKSLVVKITVIRSLVDKLPVHS
jgi:hypothetical protein